LWKSAALFMAGVIVTLVGVWASFVKGAVSRDEVSTMISNHPAIVEMKATSRTTSERVGSVEDKVDTIDVNIQKIGVAVGVSTTRAPKKNRTATSTEE
jgi:uncharacterized membrane protein